MDTALPIAGLGKLNVDVRKILTFLGLSSRKKAAHFSGNLVEVVKSISSVVDELFLEAAQHTAEDFRAVRLRLFPSYVVTVQSLADIVANLVPNPVLQTIVYESFSEIESDIREQGLNKFGAAVRDEVLFTVWTMRKIDDLVTVISKAETLPDEAQKTDAEYASKFGFNTAWAQFHLDFLLHAIRLEKQVYPEVLGEVQDGLRAIVNAYAWVRQGADLRSPPIEPLLQAPVWDEEDDDLLASSTHEMGIDLTRSDGH